MSRDHYDSIHGPKSGYRQCSGWAGKPVCAAMIPRYGNRQRCPACQDDNQRHHVNEYCRRRRAAKAEAPAHTDSGPA